MEVAGGGWGRRFAGGSCGKVKRHIQIRLDSTYTPSRAMLQVYTLYVPFSLGPANPGPTRV